MPLKVKYVSSIIQKYTLYCYSYTNNSNNLDSWVAQNFQNSLYKLILKKKKCKIVILTPSRRPFNFKKQKSVKKIF